MKRFAFFAAGAAAATLASGPAAAAEDVRTHSGLEQHRAAFAGATVRVDLGGRAAKTPQARLGIGFSPYQRDAVGFPVRSGGPTLPIAAGLASGRVQLFVGRERLSRLERRLGASGSRTTLLVIGGLAVGAAAAVLLLDGDDNDGPCPPGVEVCAQ